MLLTADGFLIYYDMARYNRQVHALLQNTVTKEARWSEIFLDRNILDTLVLNYSESDSKVLGISIHIIIANTKINKDKLYMYFILE